MNYIIKVKIINHGPGFISSVPSLTHKQKLESVAASVNGIAKDFLDEYSLGTSLKVDRIPAPTIVLSSPRLMTLAFTKLIVKQIESSVFHPVKCVVEKLEEKSQNPNLEGEQKK